MKTSESTVDFIGIGAHKSATTWLAHVMRSHKQIWIPPIKELHYFDRATHYKSQNTFASSRLITRITGSGPGNLRWRKSACRDILASAIKLDLGRCKWNLKYYTGTIDDDWYLSLFPKGSLKLNGEITPAYSMLHTQDIQHIASLLPQVKIIYLLRDPIDRAWSHLRYDKASDSNFDLGDLEAVKSYIDGPELTQRGDYLTTLRNWKSAIPDERFFIGFYDDIKSAPVSFLSNLSDFLAIDSKYFPPQEVSSTVGPSLKHEIPRDVEAYLATKYQKDLEQLAKILGGHAVRWHERSVNILKQR